MPDVKKEEVKKEEEPKKEEPKKEEPKKEEPKKEEPITMSKEEYELLMKQKMELDKYLQQKKEDAEAELKKKGDYEALLKQKEESIEAMKKVIKLNSMESALKAIGINDSVLNDKIYMRALAEQFEFDDSGNIKTSIDSIKEQLKEKDFLFSKNKPATTTGTPNKSEQIDTLDDIMKDPYKSRFLRF